MSNNVMAAAAAAAVGIYLLNKPKDKSIPDPTTTIETHPPAPSEFEVFGSSGGILGIDDITRNTQPNYDEWRRREWSLYFRDVYENELPNDAMNFVWQKWIDSDNIRQGMFPTRNALILSLLRPSEESSINDNAPFVITADSAPIYETTSNWWNGVYSWDCAQWQMWYDKMEVKYGAAQARDKFINAWTYADNWNWTWNFTAGQTCGIDCDFINYFRTKGIDVAITGASNVCTLVDVTTDLVDATKHTSEGIKNTASLASTWLPIAIVGGVVYVIAQNVKKVS
jgi:hypothetical protein